MQLPRAALAGIVALAVLCVLHVGHDLEGQDSVVSLLQAAQHHEAQSASLAHHVGAFESLAAAATQSTTKAVTNKKPYNAKPELAKLGLRLIKISKTLAYVTKRHDKLSNSIAKQLNIEPAETSSKKAAAATSSTNSTSTKNSATVDAAMSSLERAAANLARATRSHVRAVRRVANRLGIKHKLGPSRRSLRRARRRRRRARRARRRRRRRRRRYLAKIFREEHDRLLRQIRGAVNRHTSNPYPVAYSGGSSGYNTPPDWARRLLSGR